MTLELNHDQRYELSEIIELAMQDYGARLQTEFSAVPDQGRQFVHKAEGAREYINHLMELINNRKQFH